MNHICILKSRSCFCSLYIPWIYEKRNFTRFTYNCHRQRSLVFLKRRKNPRSKETDNVIQDDLLAVALRNSGIVLSVYSLMLSYQHLNCRPRLFPSSTVTCVFLQRLLYRVTWPNPTISRRLIVARRDSCQRRRHLILLRT